jgi:hypothetical protein
MARTSRNAARLDLPPEPDPDRMPIMHGDKIQLAQIHNRYFGKLSPRSLERWPLTWRKVNGRNVSSVRDFLELSKSKFESAPLVRGGSSGTT